MDDRPFYRNACFKHANVQSRAVFSFAMATMDEIYGWEDEEKAGGVEIRRMYVDLHQRCQENKYVLRKWMSTSKDA